MTLWMNIALFLPLNFVICMVSSMPRREILRDVVRHGLKMFLNLTLWIVGVCAAIHIVMEFLLNR